MKKKSKIILGAISSIAIGALIVGSSLACVEFHTDNKNDVNASKSSSKPVVNLSATNNSNVNNGNTYNDHAYMQTLSQATTINPQGSSWTKQDALEFTNNKVNAFVKMYGVSFVLRWNLIQNLNYSLIQYLKSILQQQFTINIVNFNYQITNVKNNDSLQNYRCSITLNIEFKVTSKADGATLTFNNTYIYNDVAISTNVINNGQNAYAYLILTNSLANTLTPSKVSYCNNAVISNNWTNSDFTNLQTLDWLPINNGTAITTSNYKGMLVDACARSFNNGTNQSYSQQAQFISLINKEQLFTFNIGFNFGQLNDVVIDVQGQKQNNNNLYQFNYNDQVTLAVDFADSTIISGGGNVYQWMQADVSGTNTNGITIANATSNTYQFNCYKSYKYYLEVTLPDGKTLTSNVITIDVNTSSLTIQNVDQSANSNICDASYGTSVTLSANKVWQNLSNVNYTWEEYSNSTKQFEPIQGAPNASTYSFTAIKDGVYKLVISAISGNFTISSTNTYTVSIKNNTIAINALNSASKVYSNSQEIPYGSSVQLVLQDASVWQKLSGLVYTWYKVIDSTTLESVQSTQNYLPFNISSLTQAATYELAITDPSNPAFVSLTTTINLGINNTQLAVNLTSSSFANQNVSKNANGSFDVVYGTNVTFEITSSYWNDLNNPNYVYQWYKYTENTSSATWSFLPIKGANSKTYTPTNINDVSGIYRLQITDVANPNFSLSPSNEITIITTQDDCTIQTNLADFDSYIDYGQTLTLSLASNAYWASHNENLVYTWYKQGSSKAIGNGTNLNITNATSSSAGSYYLVITNKNLPDFSIKSNSIVLNVGTPKLTIDVAQANQTKNSYQLQDTYSYDYGQQVTLQIDANDSSNAITNPSNQFQWQWGVTNNKQFTELGETSFGSYASISKYALFLSDLYPTQAKVGITYRLVMKEALANTTSTTIISNSITIVPNSTSAYLQLQVENFTYQANQNYQITYGNSVTLEPYNYWFTPPSDLKLTYDWTNASGASIGTNSSLPVNYLTANASYTLTITCATIPGFKLSSTINLTTTSNKFNLNVENTYGNIDQDNLAENSITATFGSYLCLNALNLQTYDLYNSFQYQWNYITYVNGAKQYASLPGNNALANYAFIAQQNIQIVLVITSSKLTSSQFQLESYPFSISVVNTSTSISVFKGANTWSTTPDSSNIIANNGGNNYFLNYDKNYTLGLTDYWNNPNANVSANGFNAIYENGLTYTWTSQGKVLQTSNTLNQFNPWYEMPSFTTSAIYTLTISGTVKTSLPNNLLQPQNLSEFNSFSLSTSIVLNVQNSAISIQALTVANGPVNLVNEGTYNVVYGYTPSVQVATKYFIENKQDYTFEWFLDGSATAYQSAVGLTEVTLPKPILNNGTTIQLIIVPTAGGKEIASQIITFNPVDLNVNISGYVQGDETNSSSTQVNAHYSQTTILTPSPSTSTNFNYWANSDASQYFKGLTYIWYQTDNGKTTMIQSGSNPTLTINPVQDELQYSLVIKDPNISSTFEVTSTTTITINVSYSLIQIETSAQTPKYGNAVTLSLKTPYWTKVNYQWYYNSVASGNEVPSATSINGNTTTSSKYEFYAQKDATYVLQISWTENNKTFSLTSNPITINVQDATLQLTGSGVNPDGSSVSFPSLNAVNEYVVNCWYGASNLTFSPTGYWATVNGATYQWQTSTNNGKSWSTIGTSLNSPSQYALNQNAQYRLVLTYNGLSITSGVVVLNLSNQNVDISATYNNETSTSTTNPITVPFGVPFTLSVNGAWANTNITGYTYTWYYGTNPNDSKAVVIGTGATITVLGNNVTSYDGTSLPSTNSTYNYYCIITNSNWANTDQVTATTTPTVNIDNTIPQLSVESLSTNNTLNPQDGTSQYLTNYGENIQLSINGYGWTNSSSSFNWNYGTINSCNWYVEVNGNKYEVSQSNNFSFYSLTNNTSYYVVVNGTLSNGSSFTVQSNPVTFTLQQTSLALSVTSGSTNANKASNSIVSGKDSSYVVKYGSMQIITPSSYWINYFNSNSDLNPTYTWSYNDGKGNWTSLTNNLNQSSNLFQYAQFFTNGMDGGANEGSYELSVELASISQVIPNNNNSSQTVTFKIATAQPIIIEVVGGTLGISTTGSNVSLNSGNAYSFVYGSSASVTINSGKVDWSNPSFVNNNNQYAPTNTNITLSYAWSYGTSINNLALNSQITSTSYPLGGSNSAAGFYQLVITATNSSTNNTIFTLTSNIVQVTVSENTIAIANNNGQVSGVYNYSFGENTPLQLDPTSYWAKNTDGNTYQWYCSTSPNWNQNDIWNGSSGTIFPLNTSTFDTSSTPAINVLNPNSVPYSGTLYGPNTLNLYGSGNGQSIKCTPCYAIKTKIYYWLQLTNSNWSSGTPALISNPVVINPVNNTVTIGSYSNTYSSASSDWYNPSNSYSYNFGDKVTMLIDDSKTNLPAGVSYNWQVYTGDQVYSYTTENISNDTSATMDFNQSGYYDIIPGTSSSTSTSNLIANNEYDTDPTTTSYWIHVIDNTSSFRLKVTINHVSIYSNPITLSLNTNTTSVSLQTSGVQFKQADLASSTQTSTTNQLNIAIGTNAIVKLLPNQFWSNVFNNTTGTGPFSRSYYNWTVNWTNNVTSSASESGTGTGSFQLDSKGSESKWTITFPNYGDQYTTTSNESFSWDNGIITLPQVLSNFSFSLTITAKTCIQYTPFKTYWSNAEGGVVYDQVFPSSNSFSITSNSTTVNAVGNLIGLKGMSLTNYKINNIQSTNTYTSNTIDVPYLANAQLEIPLASLSNSSAWDTNETENWWWTNVINNDGKNINSKESNQNYDISLCEVTTSLVNGNTTTSYTPVYNFINKSASNWSPVNNQDGELVIKSPLITQNSSYVIRIQIYALDSTSTVVDTFYSSILAIDCFANDSAISATPVGISTTSAPNTYSMSYLQLINNPIEFNITNNWTYLKDSTSITAIKTLVYEVGNSNPISTTEGQWQTNTDVTSWTNPFAPIYQAGQYYVKVEFYNGDTLVQSISNENSPIAINTSFSNTSKQTANDDFAIDSSVEQNSSSFDTSITNDNNEYSYDFNSFVNWQTSAFANNGTTSTTNTNPYALVTTITNADLGNTNYYGQYFADAAGSKLTISANSTTSLFTAINFAIQYQASGATSWTTYGKAVTFDANLLPSGSNYWNVITNYWLMQNASKTGQLATGINGFNPFAWTLGNQNYQWRVQAQVELAYNGTNYSYNAPSSVSSDLGNEFIFTSPTWQFEQNSTNLTLDVENSSGSVINPAINTSTPIYTLDKTTKYSLGFTASPNISWNQPISDATINPYSDSSTMYLTNPILLSVQILFEKIGATSFTSTTDSWTNPNVSINNPYAIYQSLFSNWKNGTMTNYSLTMILNHLSSLLLNSGFYEVQFTLLDASNTWLMNAQNNVDSSKWSFNYLDTITFSTTPIYIMDNTTNTSTNIALNHFNENISSDWLNISSKTAK